jgi:16S rRNA processing protein RimM
VAEEAAERGWLRAGFVGPAHGLDGSFRVAQASPQLLKATEEIRIGDRARAIERRAGHEGRMILRVAGCGDRDAAAALRGQEILVARSAAPALAPEEWWAEDLEGCRVLDGRREVGTVRRLLALPSCEVLEVERPAEQADLLVPLISDAVRNIDVDARKIDIDLAFLAQE